MEAEHFGISIVEMMAAGVIVVAHNSAGPKTDIIQQDCGFLADGQQDYVDKLLEALALNAEEKKSIIRKARQKAEQFSDEGFMKSFIADFNQAKAKEEHS